MNSNQYGSVSFTFSLELLITIVCLFFKAQIVPNKCQPKNVVNNYEAKLNLHDKFADWFLFLLWANHLTLFFAFLIIYNYISWNVGNCFSMICRYFFINILICFWFFELPTKMFSKNLFWLFLFGLFATLFDSFVFFHRLNFFVDIWWLSTFRRTFCRIRRKAFS